MHAPVVPAHPLSAFLLGPSELERLLTQSNLALAAFDGTGRVTYLSPAFQRLTGYGLNDLPDMDTWWERAFPDCSPRTGTMGPAGVRPLCLADGSRQPLKVSISSAGTGTFVIVAPPAEDTGKRTSAPAPAPARVEVDALTDLTFEGIGIYEDGVFVHANSVLASMLGLTPEKLVGRSVLDFLMPEFHPQVLGMMRDPNLSTHLEITARDCMGRPFHCELLGRLHVHRGKPARLIAVRDISIRRQAEAYRQQMTWLNLTLSSSRCGTWEWRPETNEVIWSEDLWRLYGLERDDEALNIENWFAIIHPEDRERVIREVGEAAAARRSAEVEYRVLQPDGGIVWLLSHGHPFCNRHGHLERYLGVVFDITERRRNEQALRDSEMLKRSILDSLSEHVAVLDGDGRIIETNAAWDRFTRENRADGQGDAPRTGVGANYLHICNESGESDLEGAIRSVIAGDLPLFQIEYPCPSPKEARWFQLTVTPLGQAGSGAVVSHTNISRRKAAEEALRTERDFVSAVVEAAGNVILILDRKGNVVRFNRAAQELTGFSLHEVVGRPVWDFLIPPEKQPEIRSVFENLLHQKMTGVHENEWMCKNGARRLLSWCNTILKNREGEVEFVVALGNDITDMRRNEEQLSSTLSTLRNLIEAIPYPIFLKDKDLRYVECNEHFCAMMDLPRDSVIGATVFDVAKEEQARIYDQADRALLAADDSGQVYDTVVQGRSGTPREVMFHKRKFFGANGATAGIVGIVIDVTDFRRTEQALQDHQAELERHRDHLEELIAERTSELASAEAHIRAIIDSSGDGIVELDESGRILLANPAATRILGFRPEELLGQNLHHMVHHSYPDGRPYPVEACKTYEALRTRTAQRPTEEVFWRADGSPVEVGVSTHPIHAEGARPGAVITFQDISGRKKAERKNAALAAIVENSDNIIVTKDLDLRVVATNMAFARIAGYASPADLVGKTDAEIFRVNPDTEPIRTYMEDERRAQQLGRGEFILREEPVLSTDGEPRYVLTRKYPIFDDHDRVIGTGNISMDITERKRTEEALVEARRAAEQLARIKSEFLANMSHEIRTPLNGVLGLAQIGYRDSVGRDKAQETFARILDSGKLLLSIINDILDFSKIEAGKLEIESVPFSPAKLLDNIVLAQTPQATGKKLRLLCEKSADLPAGCLGDPMRLSQVLLNLLSNAIKFTEAGEIRLGAYRDGDEILFRVSDTGIGMSPEILSRLFMPFEQADSSTTRKYGGTGLGLAISRRLVELMGAQLSVSSQPGQGSAFEIRMPLIEAEVQATVATFASGPKERRLAGLHILVAEDTPINQFVLEDFLSREGAEVSLVSDGLQAVQAVTADAERFDLVLMDVQMPVMDGLETTHRIKQIAPELTVIGQTAHAMKEERQRCRDAGMSATIVKPIEIDVLVATLLEHCHPDARPALADRRKREPDQTAPVDWLALGERFLHRREVIDRLVSMAIRSNAEKPALLRAAALNQDYKSLGELAHILKGTGGNLAARKLEQQSIALIQALSAQSPEIPQLTETLAATLENLLAHFQEGIPERI